MAKLWMVLSVNWHLGDVRSVLTVLIQIVSVLGIFAISNSLWEIGAKKLRRSSKAHLLSLVTVSSLGEVLEVLYTLNLRLIRPGLLFLTVQCLIVSALCILSLLSGPIAKVSTRAGIVPRVSTVNGLLATTNFTNSVSAPVKWNETITRLDAAGFPSDQLVDFLPDSQIPWIYRKEEWNSSFSLKCNHIPKSSLKLVTNNNISDDTLSQIPALVAAYPPELVYSDNFINETIWSGPFLDNLLPDVFLVSVFATKELSRSEDGQTRDRRLFVSNVHMHNVPKPDCDSCPLTDFGVGNVESAVYSAIDCNISLVQDPETYFKPYPWTRDVTSLAKGYVNYRYPDFSRASFTKTPIYLPTPDDLVRLLQAYMIIKDTQFRVPVSRQLSVNVPSVELSTVALSFFCVILFSILCCLAFVIGMRSRRLSADNPVSLAPRTKLEWVKQTIAEGDRFSAFVTGSEQPEHHLRQMSAVLTDSYFGYQEYAPVTGGYYGAQSVMTLAQSNTQSKRLE